MTNLNYIQWLETKIVGCDSLTGMEKEKWAFQQCLKKVRTLENMSAGVVHCSCAENEKHGETSVMCCNDCGRPTESFWQRAQ